jgi:preprotein translocase subunit YajC
MKIKSSFFSFLSIVILNIFISFQVFAQDSSAQVVAPGSAAPAAAGSPPPAWINFALMGGIILFMWLFVFRPQSKRAKEQKEFLASLTPGLEVITAGGLIGTVVEVKDNIVSVNLGSSIVRVLKSSISGKLDTTPLVPAIK